MTVTPDDHLLNLFTQHCVDKVPPLVQASHWKAWAAAMDLGLVLLGGDKALDRIKPDRDPVAYHRVKYGLLVKVAATVRQQVERKIHRHGQDHHHHHGHHGQDHRYHANSPSLRTIYETLETLLGPDASDQDQALRFAGQWHALHWSKGEKLEDFLLRLDKTCSGYHKYVSPVSGKSKAMGLLAAVVARHASLVSDLKAKWRHKWSALGDDRVYAEMRTYILGQCKGMAK